MAKRNDVVVVANDTIVLVENRRQGIVRLQNGDPKAGVFFDLIPGPNNVPEAIWQQALGVDVVQVMLEEGDLRDFGAINLSDLSTPEALEIAGRPMSLPMAQDWVKAESRKKVVDRLNNAIEAA